MDERSVLLAQIEVLRDSLRRAKETLDYPKIDVGLSTRVRSPLSIAIQEQQGIVEQLLEELKDCDSLEALWDRFRETRRDCNTIFCECLAFTQGALARSAGLDSGLCQIADALLVQFGYGTDIDWDRFTILAEVEFFVDMAQIVRLRFPDISIWTIPLAAHEFGHYMGPELRRKVGGATLFPFVEMLENEKQKGAKYWSYLHEHFADFFATFTLGPAFACTCIFLRFDPRTAYQDYEQHPSDAKRVYLILKTLEKMGSKDAGGITPPHFQPMVDLLGKLWKQSLIAAKRPESLDGASELELDTLLDKLYGLLSPKLDDAQFTGQHWLRAQTLSEQLRPDRSSALKPGPNDTLPVALNAAWYRRLRHWDEDGYALRRIEERSTELCFLLGQRYKRIN